MPLFVAVILLSVGRSWAGLAHFCINANCIAFCIVIFLEYITLSSNLTYLIILPLFWPLLLLPLPLFWPLLLLLLPLPLLLLTSPSLAPLLPLSLS